MKIKHIIITLVILVKGQILSFSQDWKNTKENYLITLEADSFFKLNNFHQSIVLEKDSLIDKTYHYLPTDYFPAFQFLGIPGLSYKVLQNSLDLNLKRNHGYFKYIYYWSENITLFKTSARYTNLIYVLGSGKEQNLNVLHSQNLLPGLNVTIDYKRLSSEGYLRRQFTKNSQFEFYPWYVSKNDKYTALGLIRITNLEIEENGGIRFDEEDLTNVEDLNLLEIQLLNASNTTKEFMGEVSQKYNFSRLDGDSSIFKQSISQQFQFSNSQSTYTDTDPISNFYPTVYYDSTVTKDKLIVDEFKSKTTYSYLFNYRTSLFFDFDLEMQRFKQRTLDTVFLNYFAGANLVKQLEKLKLTLGGEYGIGGTYTDEMLVVSKVELLLNSNNKFELTYINKNAYPDLIFSIFQSNHFSWYHIIEKENKQQFILTAINKRLNTKLSTHYTITDNYTYFNELILPSQFYEKVVVYDITLNSKLKIGRIGFDNKAIYQRANKNDILHLPEVSFISSIYYTTNLFRKALFTKSGIEIKYMSPFKGDNYMPALRQFYLQQEQEIAGYPQLNLFINLKIKTANIFLKVEDVLSATDDEYYFTTPNYPMPGTVFKFGVQWSFYD